MISAGACGADSSAESAALVPWWSYTKTALASAALVLVAQGRLALDDTLAGHPFSLRHLLQHRSGLPDYGSLDAYHAAVAAGQTPWPLQDMMHRLQTGTLLFPPGHGWQYSNVGYLLVRRLIEQAADQPLGAALQRLVFAPLGLTGVQLAQVPADLDATAWGNARGYHPGWVYHGLLVGPAESAVLLLHRLLAGALLPPALLDAMCAAHPVAGRVPGRPWLSGAYGLGLMIGRTAAPGNFIGHTGGGPGSASAVYRFVPEGCATGHRTAGAFASTEDVGAVEAHVVCLTAGTPPAV